MGRIYLLILLFLTFLFPAKTFAEDFVINNFHSDISIKESGIVEIVEKIEVDFSDNQKHGIFRDIPYTYQSDEEIVYTEVDVISVNRNNSEERFEETKNDANIRIRIGDPDKTISGKQTYRLKYTVKGVLRGFEEFDELYWNVTGNNWLTDIRSATATVSLPTPGIIKPSCYQGYAGSNGTCTANTTDQKAAKFASTQSLGASQGMTVAVSYTKGMVPILSVAPPEKYPFLKWQYLYVFLATSIVGSVIVLWKWYKEGRDIWSPIPLTLSKKNNGKNKPLFTRDNITVEFEPPEKLRPAEIGVLVDERADTLDVTSTIIDLAGRGYVKIKEVDKSWIFGKVDYELTRTNSETTSLLPYEKTLLDNLFATSETVRLSDLKMTFYDELKKVKHQLYSDVVKKGFFVEDPEKRRSNYLIIAVVLSAVSFFIMMNSLTHYYILSFLGGILFSSIFLLLFSRSMSRRSVVGSDLYRRAMGYRLFISGAEKYRQQFFEKKNMLNEILPYTIIFGLTEKFAKAMEKMGVEHSSPTWYSGTHPFTYSGFASNMNSFSSSLSTAMSSAPSSSGSSGGSSGGGFGGGGGGSW